MRNTGLNRCVASGFAVGVMLSGCAGSQPAGVPGAMLQSNAERGAQMACPTARPGKARCFALILRKDFQPDQSGWGPANFQARYHLPSSSKGAGQLVAIVDAYDNPNAASDLAEYRSTFGLGTADFAKYNQKGQMRNYPSGNKSWGVEIDLDTQMVSAGCPKCTIYLVEAKSNSTSDLYAAEVEAATLGAHIVSNSWGGGEGSASGGAFDTQGVVYLASAGDSGYGPQDPADYDGVVAVGGTILSGSGSNYTETIWPESGGGCSTITKPPWQHDDVCKYRAETTYPRLPGTSRNTTRTATADGLPSEGRAYRRLLWPASSVSRGTRRNKTVDARFEERSVTRLFTICAARLVCSAPILTRADGARPTALAPSKSRREC